MNIFGEKVVIRAIESTDRDMFLDLINDPNTERLIGGFSFPISQREQEKWMEKQIGDKCTFRGVIAKIDECDIGLGTIILSNLDFKNGIAEIHIKMSKNGGRGKGYASDALRATLRYAFNELRMHCLYAVVLSYNDASKRLFENCGFKREGVLRHRIYKNGKYEDAIIYSLLESEI